LRPGAPIIAAPMLRSFLLALPPVHAPRLAERPEAPGFATALTFGDVPAEYAAGRHGCALLDVSDRGRVAVRGADAADFLHRLLANHVRSLAPGHGNRNLLLTSKGKVRHAFDLVRTPEGFELSTAPGAAAALAEALETFHFSEDVRLEERSESHAPLEVHGPGAAAVLARILGTPPPEPSDGEQRLERSGGPVTVRANAWLGAAGWRLDAGPDGVAALWNTLVEAGATPCGLVARDSLRVEVGSALPGLDVDENVYPQEAALADAFALDKGCYVGQEVVAKIDTYGGINKHLVGLRIDHSDPVARGTVLVRELDGERRELGLVTSWAYSFALDTGMALGYAKRRHAEPGTAFELAGGSGTATVVALPVAAG
jgi:folate-binding protein YgfZ